MTGEQVALQRIGVGKIPGTGKLRVTGRLDRAIRDLILTAFGHLRGDQSLLDVERDIGSFDFLVQVFDLLTSGRKSPSRVAFLLALLSLLREKPVQSDLVVPRKMTIHSNIRRC